MKEVEQEGRGKRGGQGGQGTEVRGGERESQKGVGEKGARERERMRKEGERRKRNSERWRGGEGRTTETGTERLRQTQAKGDRQT